jgi:bifunctional DNA-binding transcriptional regulator/antitoxin component of YhaV-PrlF toxin-antitoxin module
LRVLESKVFANGSTTLPKLVREALGVEAGDTVRYVISEDRVQVLRMPSEKADADDLNLYEALDAAEDVMFENRRILRQLK